MIDSPITYGITDFDQNKGEVATYDVLKRFPRYTAQRACPANGTAQCVSAKPVSMASMYVCHASDTGECAALSSSRAKFTPPYATDK